MPVDRSRYPESWPAVRRDILERAGGACERCGVPNGLWIFADRTRVLETSPERDVLEDPVFWRPVLSQEALDTRELEPGTFTPGRRYVDPVHRKPVSRVVLTIAHIHDEDPTNVDPANLEALCQYCHNRLDAPRRAERRRLRRIRAGAHADLFERRNP